ncbi:acid phosphatase [Pseudomonas sp. A46]|nr:phosphatase PAP2 family protein [Pseudomonas sp. A46]OWJ93976.1 acid phosphatase [Pseudomonas sp. A46]
MLAKSRFLIAASLLALSVGLQAEPATPRPYLPEGALPLAEFLPPPPAQGSQGDDQDLQRVLDAQANRTPEQVEQAKRDDHLTDAAFPFARGIFGPDFTVEKHPHTARMFRRVLKDLVQTLMPAKHYYARPRPYERDDRVQPILPPPQGESYPSGHTMDAYLTATLLAHMVPERRQALFERADAAAHSRVIAGVHYPSDLDGGRVAAAVLAGVLLTRAEIREDFELARQEVRRTLQLP